MESVFKTELISSEVQEIQKFCSGADYFALEQSIGFSKILYTTKVTYFYLLDGKLIKSFCQINEHLKFAHIWFGPVCNSQEDTISSISEIVKYYKDRGFWYLGIQMYKKSGNECDYIEYHLNRFFDIKYFFDNENTKSSLEIDLSSDLDKIYGGFRKGHKSDIKRAVNLGIRVVETDDENDVKAFSDLYRKMCDFRLMRGHSATEVQNIIGYLKNNQLGILLLAKDSSNNIIGGSIFAFQGISVRYLLSASDPDKRDLPVTHLIIYRAVEMAKEHNFRYFDFWGYNHFADKDDPISKVNSFKKGFGGYFTFFAKKMNINLIYGGYNIYQLFKVMKRITGKFK